MNCQEARENFSLYLYGELDFAAEEIIEEHLAQCPACAEALERERQWHAAAGNLSVDAPMELLSQCRRDLSRSLRYMNDPARPSRWTRFLEALDISPGHWAAQLAAASLLIGLGFGASRLLNRSPIAELLPGSDAASVAGMTARLRSVEPTADPAKLTFVYDEVRTRTVTVSRDDPETVRVLSAAATSQLSSDPAFVADVMDSLSGLESSTAVSAILNVASSNPSPGLRWKAVDALGPYALRDPGTQLAVLHIVRTDPNLSVRLKAASLLSQVQTLAPDPSLAGALQDLNEHEPGTCSLMHCQQKLREIKASLGTY